MIWNNSYERSRTLIISLIVVTVIVYLLSHIFLPAWLAQLVTLFAGATVSLLFTRFVPKDINDRITYYVNRIVRSIKSPTLEIRLSRRYDFQEPIRLSTLSNEFQSALGVSPIAELRFENRREASSYSVEQVIRLYERDIIPVPNESVVRDESGERTVEYVQAKYKIMVKYSELSNGAMTAEEMDREFERHLSDHSFETKDYSMTCEFENPKLFKNLIGTLDVSNIHAELDSGVTVDLWEDEIRVNKIGGGEFASVVKLLDNLVTYYL